MQMISKSKFRHRDRLPTIVFFFQLASNENKVYWLNSMLSLNMWLITWSYAYGINIMRARLSSKIFFSIRTSTRVMRSFSGSRFQLQLVNDDHQMNNDQSHLRVVEISSFKHLTHLSLLVTSANDHEIKNYLARRLQSKTVRLTRSDETRRSDFTFIQADHHQLSQEHEKLKKELELTQTVSVMEDSVTESIWMFAFEGIERETDRFWENQTRMGFEQ